MCTEWCLPQNDQFVTEWSVNDQFATEWSVCNRMISLQQNDQRLFVVWSRRSSTEGQRGLIHYIPDDADDFDDEDPDEDLDIW